MKTFIVDYDLRKQGQDYSKLQNRLKEWRAVPALYSSWVVRWKTDVVTLRDDLAKCIDGNDGLLVVEVSAAAWQGITSAAAAALREPATV